ncbi:hypothetical protein OC846_005596 [Tilletia horrida]|uniref:Transmembrane protein n=1 Tax=Tilletia horrida TaxID=155126 RepID=A0AAN6GMP4_9BASI|nr:hypothetical protein OC846_005596 [Tilletia horrida]KAK0562968.1 hypothetical protein OC861_005058 [Tilletia horrida]
MADNNYGIPAFATASMQDFSDFIEVFVEHRMPRPFLALVFLYAAGHMLALIGCVPIFYKQISSGRFWLVRLVSTKSGHIIVPNHLDASATLIGGYALYDIGYCIKLLLCYYNKSGQRNLPALLCMRFIILTGIGWIFLIGFFLVAVPPSTFRIPAWIWNVGIFLIPFGIQFGILFLLVKAVIHWNGYWDAYLQLRPSIDQSLASGQAVPSQAQLETAYRMIGVEAKGYSQWILKWAVPLYTWTALFGAAILVITLYICLSHWGQFKTAEDLPMQSRPTGIGSRGKRSAPSRPTNSMTASAGIREWRKKVQPASANSMPPTSTLSSGTGSTLAYERLDSEGRQSHEKDDENKRRRKRRPAAGRMALYLLGLAPFSKDAYNDPTGGFNENVARASLRSLLLHTAVQGGCVSFIALIQVSTVVLLTRPGWLNPLDTDQLPGWGVAWAQTTGVYQLLEFYGTGLPGLLLITSILIRQVTAIKLARARAREGVVGATVIGGDGGAFAKQTLPRSGEGFHLSAPGPSASAQWRSQRTDGIQEEDEEEGDEEKYGHEQQLQRQAHRARVQSDPTTLNLSSLGDESDVLKSKDGKDEYDTIALPGAYQNTRAAVPAPATMNAQSDWRERTMPIASSPFAQRTRRLYNDDLEDDSVVADGT